LKLPVIIIIFLLFFVAIADATEYTITPSKNLNKPPGTAIDGKIGHEAQPIPIWFAMLLTIFPQMAVLNLESIIIFKSSVYIGYVKIKQSRSRNNAKKEAIYHLIETNPGMYFREIQRKSGLLKGTFEYHMKNLEQEGRVNSIKNKGKVHYFANNSTYSSEEITIHSVMDNESLKHILFETCTKSIVTNKEIADRLDLSKSSVSEKLNYLKGIGILNAKKDGWYTFYEISKEYVDAIQYYFSKDISQEQNREIENEKIASF
jgi:predicted transcriptional regulator